MIIGGSYDTLATTIYLQITGAYDKAGAAAMAVVLLCITLAMFAVQKYYLERKTAATPDRQGLPRPYAHHRPQRPSSAHGALLARGALLLS